MTRSRDRLFWLLILAAVALRLYGIDFPLTDGGQERQTQVAMIARNLLRDNFNVFLPRIDIFPPDPGYVLLEFPLQPLLMALCYFFVGVYDWIGRAIALVFDVGSIWFFYHFATSLFNRKGALWAAAIYSLTPMSIFFGRAVFPEPVFLFFSMGSLYFAMRYAEIGKGFYWSLGFAALACLLKSPPGLVMIFPIAVILRQRLPKSIFRDYRIVAYCCVAAFPVIAWALWARQVSAPRIGWNPYQLSALERWGIPFGWFDPKFYLQVLESLFAVALTPIVFIFALIGLFKIREHKRASILISWLIALTVYAFGTPAAQATHWNYHLPFVPLGAILGVYGFYYLGTIDLGKRIYAWISATRFRYFGTILIVVGLNLPIYGIVLNDAYDLKKRLPYGLEVGEIVRNNVPKEGFVLLIEPAIVAVPQTYHMDRRALYFPPVGIESFSSEDIKKQEQVGANAIVAVDTMYGSGVELLNRNLEALAYVKNSYRLVAQHEHYLVFVK